VTWLAIGWKFAGSISPLLLFNRVDRGFVLLFWTSATTSRSAWIEGKTNVFREGEHPRDNASELRHVEFFSENDSGEVSDRAAVELGIIEVTLATTREYHLAVIDRYALLDRQQACVVANGEA
jgi:hypothetical protein